MDHRAGLTANSGATDDARPATVRVDQAIFTSIRTPMGEGYRLIAVSPGITNEERAEMTRRSPSHGSLCDPDPGASALSSYRLGSARHCVAWTRYAGREHTARGGYRVHTHLVVLDPTDFLAMAHDPFRVHVAMQEALGEEPCLESGSRLEGLTLLVPGPEIHTRLMSGGQTVEQACRVAVELLGHEVLLVVGSESPLEVLSSTMAVLPQAWRMELAVSANLHYAPARQFRLTCVGQNSPELKRAVHGQNVHVLDLTSGAPLENSPYADWFELVRERHEQGRLAESLALADQLDGSLDGPTLARIVAVCRDADRVEEASREVLEKIVTDYADVQPCHPVEVRLIRQLLSAAVHRAGELPYRNPAGVAMAW